MQSYTNILYIFLRFLISQSAAILQVVAFGAKKQKNKKKKEFIFVGRLRDGFVSFSVKALDIEKNNKAEQLDNLISWAKS